LPFSDWILKQGAVLWCLKKNLTPALFPGQLQTGPWIHAKPGCTISPLVRSHVCARWYGAKERTFVLSSSALTGSTGSQRTSSWCCLLLSLLSASLSGLSSGRIASHLLRYWLTTEAAPLAHPAGPSYPSLFSFSLFSFLFL